MKLSYLDIVSFAVDNMPWLKWQERELYKAIRKHDEYKTLFYEVDYKGLMYAMTWNYSEDSEEVFVTALCVREDLRSLKMIKSLILKVWLEHPYIKSYKFVRDLKYPGRAKRNYSLLKMFEKEIKDGITKGYAGNAHATTTC